MPEPNELLRAARLRMESPKTPGQSMTRQELADAVNAQVYRASGESRTVTAIDANHVGKWERGQVRRPAEHYRAALRVVLDVATDADLGFNHSSTHNIDDVDRKTFLKTALGTGAGLVLSRHFPDPTADANDLAAAIAGPTTYYRRMESVVSSEQLSPAVEAHLSLSSGIVNAKLRTSTGFGVLAEVSGLSAWLAVDRGDNATARRRYVDAVNHAEHASHPLLVSYMTASLGHFAVDDGQARQGVRLLDRAAGQLDKTAPDTARAWLASLQAVAHAALGDRSATFSALRGAEKLTSRQRGEPHWPWVFTFDEAKAARYQASALGRLGDLRGATSAFEAAQPALTSPKPRALAEVDQAQVMANAGLVGEACQLALNALNVAREYGSERITARVRDFHATLPTNTAEARDLDEALAALYETETS